MTYLMISQRNRLSTELGCLIAELIVVNTNIRSLKLDVRFQEHLQPFDQTHLLKFEILEQSNWQEWSQIVDLITVDEYKFNEPFNGCMNESKKFRLRN